MRSPRRHRSRRCWDGLPPRPSGATTSYGPMRVPGAVKWRPAYHPGALLQRHGRGIDAPNVTFGEAMGVNEDAPPAVEDGWHTLDPRTIELDRAAGAIATVVLSFGWLVAVAILGLVADAAPWLVLALAVLWLPFTVGIALFFYRWPVVEYRHTRYRVDDELIEIERGVLWRRSMAVPRSRVQHIDVIQGPLMRHFGLGQLSIYTAGTQYSRVTLPGLAYDIAQRLRSLLLPRESPGDGV